MAAGIAALAATGYEVIKAANEWDQKNLDHTMESQAIEEDAEARQKDEKKKKPPYEGKELGDDPTKCPGEGFEWKGKGKPGSNQGSWVKGTGKTKEILYPDLDHPDPIGPHWDYTGPEFQGGTRLYPDGTWEPKL